MCPRVAEALGFFQLDALSWFPANGRLAGWNGPIFQFSGKPQKLQLGAVALKFGIQVGGVLVFHVQLGVLLVAGISISRVETRLHCVEVSLGDLPFQLGYVARRRELPQ